MDIDSDGATGKAMGKPLPPLRFASVSETARVASHRRDSCNVLEQLVSPHPLEPSASITTILSETTAASSTRLVVSVYSGPDCGHDAQVHACFTLQAMRTTETLRKRLCWTSFAHTHPLLCVLVDPTTVSVYDVYPDKNAPDNTDYNWTLSLPFDCDAIEALPKTEEGSHFAGLLLQRKPDPADEDESSQFILKSPPKIWTQHHVPPPDEHAMQEPSLFSLHHPLEDIQPVAFDASASHIQTESVFDSPLVTDPFEKILWAGTAYWDREQSSQVLAVTYHSIWKRHAVWAIKEAEKPPAPVPLYRQTAQLMTANSNRHGVFQDTFLLPHDLEPDEFSVVPSSAQSILATRQEALADALGVKRTPRQSIEPALNASNIRSRQQRSGTHHNDLFSPRSEQVDSSHASWMTAAPQVNNSQSHDFHQGPFGPIHSKITLSCLYMESNNNSQPAKRIFLASNSTASGNLCLCLIKSGLGFNGKSNLALLDLQATDDKKLSVSCRETGSPTSIECVSAEPVTVARIPGSLTSSKRASMATDILVLTVDHRLQLYRASQAITECAALEGEYNNAPVAVKMSDGVENRVTVNFLDDKGDCTVRRLRLKLQPSDFLAESVLSALDSAFAQEPWMTHCPSIALKIRVDVCRLEQRLRDAANSMACCSDCGWIACTAVLLFLVHSDLFEDGSLLDLLPKDTQASRSAWDFLVATDLDNTNAQSLLAAARELEDSGSQAALYLAGLQFPKGLTPSIFDALHFLNEEYKLSCSTCAFVPKLAHFLLHICSFGSPLDDGMEMLRAYYAQDAQETGSPDTFSAAASRTYAPKDRLTSFTGPPSLLSWVTGIFNGKASSNSHFDGRINPPCVKTKAIVRVCSALFSGQSSQNRIATVVEALQEEGLCSLEQVHETLPLGIALPCLEALYRCRNDPALAENSGWSANAWSLVGRHDIARNIAPRDQKETCMSTVSDDRATSNGDYMDVEGDGLVLLERSSALLFEDNRIHEAGRLLCSSRPIFLRVIRTVETSDHDYERQKQKKLALLARRSLALSVGRGMLTLGTLQPVAAEPLPIPDLCLKGRVPPTNASLALDESESPSDMRVWPAFHNGVAAGLRLKGCDETMSALSRTWIVYNRPEMSTQSQEGEEANQLAQRKSHSHGGLLLALGLRGHLTALEMSDVYDYLTKGQVTITIGVLLGLAANKRGSCDMAVSKMLCLHIPSLIPNHFSAIDVASTVQAAAVTGTGLLFLNSSNRMITEFLLNEIGKRPETDMTVFDREAYTLACGLALGMVNLSIGDKTKGDGRAQGLADLRLEERLHTYIKGGIDADERKRNRETSDRFSIPSSTANGDNERCSTVFEGDQINIDITAPAATLALGLMYMKTGNQTIASMLELPDTHFTLEFVRPDFLSLRVVARTLVLWNHVDPSSWIAQQIPQVISDAYNEMRENAKRASEGDTSADLRGKPDSQFEYDRRAVRQIYVHILAGSCFGLGLRFAGTGDERARAAILERIMELHTLRESNDLVSSASRPDYPVLETCLGCAALSLAMVLAGTGDLDALRLFKMLRWRCEEDSTYGYHMVYGMAIGLLFLGGGSCTLGREADDIAALVAAFFPRFPVGTSDNQYHLQACRHLYVLAVKRKELRAVDVDTNEVVSVPVEIRFNDAPPVRASVPCLLRNTDLAAKELVLVSDNYYPLTICLRRPMSSFTFYVKKRARCLGETAERGLATLESNAMIGSTFLRCVSGYLGIRENSFIALAIENCNGKGAEEALSLYLSPLFDRSANSFWDLKLFHAFYSSVNERTTRDGLMNVELLLPYMIEKVEQSLVEGLHTDSLPIYAATMYGSD